MTRLGRLVVVLLVGCLLPTMAGASTPVPAPRSPSADDGARYVRLDARLDLGETGISLLPVPVQQAAPPISAPRAFQTCRTGGSLCDPALTPDIYLALADKPDSGLLWRLVWVIDYSGSTCVPFGIPPAGTADPALVKRMLTPYRCRLVNLVDSTTGRTLWSVRF